MGTLVAGLKWLAKFLEARFPEPFHPENFVLRGEYKATVDVVTEELTTLHSHDAIALEEIKKLSDRIEKISLLIGLSRPMQTILKQGAR